MILHDKELESAILGISMLESTAFGRTYGLIDQETFYTSDNQKVYRTLRAMYDLNLPIDLITVHLKMTEREEKFDAGNIPWYLAELTKHVVSSTHLEYHCWLLKDMWRKRELTRLTSSGIDVTTDVKKQIRDLNNQLTFIQGNEFKKEWMTMDELMVNLVTHQQEIASGKKEFITTGFKAIDKENGGFTAGQLIVLGARPSVGKSAIMGKMAMSQAIRGKKVGIISMEMNNIEIAARLSSLESDIEFYRIHRNLFLDEKQSERFYETAKKMSNLPIYVSDKTRVDINEIKAKASKLKNSYGVDCLMVDYMQLVENPAEKSNYNREQEVAKISRGLKLLSMDMEIPVIVLCQLNRNSTQRKGTERYPRLSDLRESGAIEQDADVVMMLHRDWLIDGFQEDKDGNSTELKADLLVQKWRNGATCHLELEWEPQKMRFKEKTTLQPVNSLPQGNWKPYKDDDSETTLYIQKGSRMSDGEFDDETPF